MMERELHDGKGNPIPSTKQLADWNKIAQEQAEQVRRTTTATEATENANPYKAKWIIGPHGDLCGVTATEAVHDATLDALDTLAAGITALTKRLAETEKIIKFLERRIGKADRAIMSLQHRGRISTA